MPGNVNLTQKVWVGLICFIVGVLFGYFVLPWLIPPPTPIAGGTTSISHYERVADTGKILLTVPQGDTAIIGSLLKGPTNKAVRIINAATGALVNTNSPTSMPMHKCGPSMPDSVGWILPPGSYQIYVLYDWTAASHCADSPPPPKTTYISYPAVSSGTLPLSLIEGGPAVRNCVVDFYQWNVAVHGDQTQITIMLEGD